MLTGAFGRGTPEGVATEAKRKPQEPRAPHPDLEQLPGRLAFVLAGRQQKWLAEKSGVEESGISRILNGHSLVGVTADTVLRLARRLGCDPGWLLSGDGAPFANAWVRVAPGAPAAVVKAVQAALELEAETPRERPHKRQRPGKNRK